MVICELLRLNLVPVSNDLYEAWLAIRAFQEFQRRAGILKRLLEEVFYRLFVHNDETNLFAKDLVTVVPYDQEEETIDPRLPMFISYLFKCNLRDVHN